MATIIFSKPTIEGVPPSVELVRTANGKKLGIVGKSSELENDGTLKFIDGPHVDGYVFVPLSADFKKEIELLKFKTVEECREYVKSLVFLNVD